MVNSPPGDPRGLFLLAHGAGKGMASSFLETLAHGLTDSGLRVVRFNFPYMARMLSTGERKNPNSGKVLRKCFSDVISHCVARERVPPRYIFIGGKSMGGRAAAMVADNHKVSGVICFGYPFRSSAPGKYRIGALRNMQTPTLICQGERDPDGIRDEVAMLDFSDKVHIHWVHGAGKNYKLINNTGSAEQNRIQDVIKVSNEFISRRIKESQK